MFLAILLTRSSILMNVCNLEGFCCNTEYNKSYCCFSSSKSSSKLSILRFFDGISGDKSYDYDCNFNEDDFEFEILFEGEVASSYFTLLFGLTFYNWLVFYFFFFSVFYPFKITLIYSFYISSFIYFIYNNTLFILSEYFVFFYSLISVFVSKSLFIAVLPIYCSYPSSYYSSFISLFSSFFSIYYSTTSSLSTFIISSSISSFSSYLDNNPSFTLNSR